MTMTMTTKLPPAAALATLMMFAPTLTANDISTIMLSRVVEAQAAAMDANKLLAAGVIGHDRYEAAANDRDDAIDAAAAFLAR